MQNNNVRNDPLDGLFKIPIQQYGDKYKEHLLEQYKLYVQMADKISDRRATANSFFLSLNSFLLTVLGVLPQLESNIVEFTQIWVIVVAIGGITFCLAWIMLIRGYRKLNGAKFKVINKIEEKLPLSMYESEWKYLGGLKEKMRFGPLTIGYSPLSLIERWVPVVIIFLYISLAIGGILVSLGIMRIPLAAFGE